MRSFISYFLRLKGSAGRTAVALLICSKDRKILIKIKILKMRLRLPYHCPNLVLFYLFSVFFAPQKLDRPPSVGVFFYLLELAVATVANSCNSGKISPQNTYLEVPFVGVLALSIGIGHTRDCLSVVTRRFCPVLLNLIIRIATLFSLGAFSLPLSQSPKVPLVEHQVRSWWIVCGLGVLL